MSLLAEVSQLLTDAGIGHALIGAGALAVHGLSRSTVDIDLLVISTACLEDAPWRALRAGGAEVEVRRGDEFDPLAGVVRVVQVGERPVDVIVGRSAWQRGVLERARPATLLGATVPVATAADLVLLKLYAGGPQDAWDIQQLLDGEDGPVIAVEVSSRLSELAPACRQLWQRIRQARE